MLKLYQSVCRESRKYTSPLFNKVTGKKRGVLGRASLALVQLFNCDWLKGWSSPYRIKGISPKVMKVIHMLRLRKIFSGTFVKINKTSVSMMKVVEPYVAWGWVMVSLLLQSEYLFFLNWAHVVFQIDFPTWSQFVSSFWREDRPKLGGGGFLSQTTHSLSSKWVRVLTDWYLSYGRENQSFLQELIWSGYFSGDCERFDFVICSHLFLPYWRQTLYFLVKVRYNYSKADHVKV